MDFLSCGPLYIKELELESHRGYIIIIAENTLPAQSCTGGQKSA